jgi:hypothetical protein
MLSIATELEDKISHDNEARKRPSDDARTKKSNRVIDFVSEAASMHCDPAEGLLDTDDYGGADSNGQRAHPQSRKSLGRRATNQGYANYGSHESVAMSALKAEHTRSAKNKRNSLAKAGTKATLQSGNDPGDPGGSDSSDSDGSESNPSDGQGPTHRRSKPSSTPKLFKEMGDLWNVLNHLQTTINKDYKECPAMIHHGGLAHVAKEIKKVYKFMEEEQQRVSVVKILSDDFKSHLKVKYGCSSDEFVTMTIQELFPFLSAENTVLNPARFYEQLQYALKDTKVQPWSEVNVFNHQRFYYSQLNFIANFRMLLSIMMTTNSSQAPPG